VLGDHVAVMNAGRIVQAASAREVYDRPATRSSVQVRSRGEQVWLRLDRSQVREVD
jgi:ABC-type sulfate/molybdate transport systems ATPase subunit